MAGNELARAVRALGWGVEIGGTALAGSASGAGVYLVQVDGQDAVLKVTAAGDWQPNARRELTFYQTLADRVPVATPRLLRYADDECLTALLLSAHTPALPAREWDRSAWLEVSRQLAQLHSVSLPDQAAWHQTPFAGTEPDEHALRLAKDYWSATDAADCIALVLDDPDVLMRAVKATPECFAHGDCHVDNLLRDGDRIVWADWQVAAVGYSAGDLAFLWSRADADGADLPYAAMVHEYATHRGVDATVLSRGLVAAELRILLFGWPHHAAFCAQDVRDRLTRRFRRLATDWHRHTGPGQNQLPPALWTSPP